MKKDILGVKIDDINMENALEEVKALLEKPGKHYIVTPNPEIIMLAQKDSRYKSILNDADLSIPDGIGLKLTGKVKNTVKGVDLMEQLVSKSKDWGFTIGFLGGKIGVAEKCADCLRKKYPGAKIVYSDSGGLIDENGEWVEGNRKALISMDVLFVAFGPPKQEKWIKTNLKNIPVKIAIGVGGALDYLSGEVIRAPKILRDVRLEWLFRLITQPWRIKRQMALIKYVLMIL